VLDTQDGKVVGRQSPKKRRGFRKDNGVQGGSSGGNIGAGIILARPGIEKGSLWGVLIERQGIEKVIKSMEGG